MRQTGRRDEPSLRAAEPCEPPVPDDALVNRVGYMADLIAELRAMAGQLGLGMLEGMLGLAQEEAGRIADAQSRDKRR